MKMMIQETCHRTLRIYISNPKSVVIAIMDCVSLWGGADKAGANYGSWEVRPDMRAVAYRCAGSHGISIEEFELMDDH